MLALVALVSRRLRRRVRRDFPQAEATRATCQLLAQANVSERVQAAIVLAAAGDADELRTQAELAATDWRDVLVNGGLANADWRRRLRAELGWW